MTATIPTPLQVAFRSAPIVKSEPEKSEPVLKAVVGPELHGRVTTGLVDHAVEMLHDGVVKTKHLKPGQVVRPFLHGEPRGGERTVQSVVRIEEGGEFFRVEFESAHPAADYKAAYRWHDATLAGSVLKRTTVKRPALVPYVEV